MCVFLFSLRRSGCNDVLQIMNYRCICSFPEFVFLPFLVLEDDDMRIIVALFDHTYGRILFVSII